jgi:hypothetical protein
MGSINVSSNINRVIDSVDGVRDDLITEMRKRVGRVMQMLKQRVTQYVRDDADYTGHLAHAIHRDDDLEPPEMKFSVATDSDIAPYAAIIEFGSGSRTNDEWGGSRNAPPPSVGSAVPRGFPYESPDMDVPPEENKYKLTGYANFAGFVGHIEEWMRRKPVEPESGDVFTSAVAIAYTIVTRGNHAHPFMRPAWFDKELQVKSAARNALRKATR